MKYSERKISQCIHPLTTRDQTRQHETTRVQRDTKRGSTSVARVQHETIRVQNNIKFILIYLYHRCNSEPCTLGSKALFMF